MFNGSSVKIKITKNFKVYFLQHYYKAWRSALLVLLLIELEVLNKPEKSTTST